MKRRTEIILEAAKRPATSKSAKKVEDPNEINRKLRGLAHRVGYIVHAGLNTKGGAGYRGEVIKIEKHHTFIKLSNNKIVKAPHHLVSVHKNHMVKEETKIEKKERLKREAEIATKSFRKYQNIEDKSEAERERSKHRHEHERKLHREDVDIKKTHKSLGEYMRRRAKVERERGNIEKADKHDQTAAHWERLANEETNTEKRQKESLIGRPNDPPVTSKKSVLHKTLQIKTRILD